MGRMRSFLGFFTGLALSFFVIDAFAAMTYTCPSKPKYTSCEKGYYMTLDGTYNGTPKAGNTCTICPAGYYCPGGTADKRACGLGSYAVGTGNATCTACPAGQTTNGTGQTSKASCVSCTNDNNFVNAWKEANWKDTNTVTNLCTVSNCKAGSYYNSMNGRGYSGSCKACPDGEYMSSNGHTYTSCTACTPETGWTAKTGITGATSRASCYLTQTPDNCVSGTVTRKQKTLTIGYDIPTVTEDLVAKEGYYVNGTACMICTAGNYCPGGTTKPQECPTNWTSDEGISSKDDCHSTVNLDPTTEGTVTVDSEGTRKIYAKYNGTFYLDAEFTELMTTSQNPITTPTANGWAFDGYAGTISDCKSGTRYINSNGYKGSSSWSNGLNLVACWTEAYIKCEAGEYYNGTSRTCMTCPAGSYCPDGKNFVDNGIDQGRNLCEPGTYQTLTGQTSCTKCEAGTFSDTEGAKENTCTVCATGHYSDAGASECSPCADLGSTTSNIGTNYRKDRHYTNSGKTAADHAYNASCKITCPAGSLVVTPNALCSSISSSYYTGAVGKHGSTSSDTATNDYYRLGWYVGENTWSYGDGLAKRVDQGGDYVIEFCEDLPVTSPTYAQVVPTNTDYPSFRADWRVYSPEAHAGKSACQATIPEGAMMVGVKTGSSTFAINRTLQGCAAGSYCPGGTFGYPETVTTTTRLGTVSCSADSDMAGYTSATGAKTKGSCYLSVPAGYVRDGTSGTTKKACAAGTYKAAHYAYYGTEYECDACTGRTQFSAAGAESCSIVDTGYYTTGCDSNGDNCTGQDQCTSGTYCEGGEQKNCEALTPAVAVTGGKYSSAVGSSANTACEYTAPSKTHPECSSIEANRVSYNGTAWGTDFYTVLAKAGARVSATGNTSAPACELCEKGTKSDGGEIYTCEDCENKNNVASWGANACEIEKCEADYYLLDNKCVACADNATCDGTANWECNENYKKNDDGTACVLDVFRCEAGKAADGTECTEGYYCPGETVVAGQEYDTANGCERTCPAADDDRKVSSVAAATSIGQCVASGTVDIYDSGKSKVTGSGTKSCAWDGDSYDRGCEVKPEKCFAGYYKTAGNNPYCNPVGTGYYRGENDPITTRYACSDLHGANGATTETETSGSAEACYNKCTSVTIENGKRDPVNAKEYYNGTEIPVCSYTVSCDYGYSADGDVCKPNVYTITLDHNGGNSDVAAIYLKYGDGWYANVDATEKIESVDVPTKTGNTFGGYIYSGELMVNAKGNITAGNMYFRNNATIVASWADNPTISCGPGLYYPGTGNECLECEPGYYCEGGITAVQDAGIVAGRKTCPSGEGTYSPAIDKDGNVLTVKITSQAKAESVDVCYATNVSYKPNQQTTGGQTCMYNKTSGLYNTNCGDVVVYACAGGYALADNTSNICTEVGKGYYSEDGEITKTQCPIYSGEERGTTASTTAVNATDCFMDNIWFENDTSGQRRQCFYSESQQKYDINCQQSVVVTCAAGYWYDESRFVGDTNAEKYCVPVGAGAWSPAQSECAGPDLQQPIEAGCSTKKNTCPGTNPQTKIDALTGKQMTTASSISDCVLACEDPGLYCDDNNEAIGCPEGSYCTKGVKYSCDTETNGEFPLSAAGSDEKGDCYQSCKLYCDRISEDKWEEKAKFYNANSCSKNGNVRIAGGKFHGTSTCVLLPDSEVPTECVLGVYCDQGYYYTRINDFENGKCDLCSNLGGGYIYSVHGALYNPDSKTGSKACYKVEDLMCTAPVCPQEGTGTCSYDGTENVIDGGYEFYDTGIVLPGTADAFLCEPTGEGDSYFECFEGYTKKDNPDIDPTDGTADKPEDLCTPTVYTMKLHANDGSDASYEVYQKYKDGWYADESATTKLEKIPVPERENYTFKGYYTRENRLYADVVEVVDAEGNLKADDAKSATYTDNMDLYAWWEANVYVCKSGFYYVGNPDGSGSEVACKTGDKFYCPGTGKVLVTDTGCRVSCPVAEGADGDPTTTTDGATANTECSATFGVNPANGQELANGDATWVCEYQSDTGRYSGCEVRVKNCVGGYYEVSSTCAVVESGYYSPAGETKQTQCPQKTNYKIGTDVLRDAKTDCYVDCTSYVPEITHSTNVYVTTGTDYRKMFWSESDEKYPECNYTVVCETGYAAVSGTAPRCDAKTYMITLDKNGGNGDIADSVSCKFDSGECALPATSVLKRTGYNSVNKWCTNKDGTGKCYAAGETSKENISADASDMTLYAIWTPVVLKIDLDTSTTEEGVTVENAVQGPVYLKYETGWFSDADATQPITSIGTKLPMMANGYAFAGYKLNDVTIVDGAGTLVYSPAALTVTTTDATATVIWAATKTSCEPGYYYPGTGSKCAVCEANHWCPGGEFGTDNGNVGGLIKCSEGGLSNGGVDATNIGVCYKTGMSYQTFIDGDVNRIKAKGTWICNFETVGYTNCHEDTLEINWCAGGYWYDESQTSIDCVVVGEDYWSEEGELVKHACPADGGDIYGTRVTNGGNTNGAITSDSLTNCEMRMDTYATTGDKAKGSHICSAEADDGVARYNANCRLDTVEINWCAGGYWYNKEFSTTDCQEVGNNWYSAEGDMTRNPCPHGGTTDVTTATQADGVCRKTVIYPGAEYNGPDVNGVGQRGCSYESKYDGHKYGDNESDGYVYNCAEVVMTQCDAGYWWQRGKEICEEVGQGFFGPVADPNNGNNKTGRMACPDNGLTDGIKSADATACYLEELECDITNGTGKQTRYYDSAVVSDTAGYNACFANGQAVECDTMCTITGCDSGYSLVDGACINCPADHVCTPEEGKRSCADITGGTHVKSDAGTTDAAYCYAECALDKNAYEMHGRDYYGAEVADTCKVVACSAGYTLSDGECVVCPAGMVCNPEIDGGMPKSCATLTGGEYTKSEPGADSINDCYMVCEPYDVVNGTAVPVQDSVNYPQECEYEGKSLNGNPCDIVDGVCVETSCNYNYEMDNGVCKPCAREHAVSYKKNGNCIVESCANGYHPNGTKCESDVVKCTAPNAVTATQTWNSKQNAFGPCVITSCEDGYHLGANTCQVDEQVCELEHGVGVREWNHNTNTWGQCVATKCDPGYTNDPSQTNELWEQCGRCNNMYGANGDLAVSSYVQGCEIAACMYQGEKYALEDNECHLICDTYSDDTGTRRWNEARKKCERTCEPGYTSW